MATYNKYQNGVAALVSGINSGTDNWKIALASTINPADTTFVAGTTDLPTANGYTAGGNPASIISSSRSIGSARVSIGWRPAGFSRKIETSISPK